MTRPPPAYRHATDADIGRIPLWLALAAISVALVLAMAFCTFMPVPAHAQSVGTYVESATGSTRNGIGIQLFQGTSVAPVGAANSDNTTAASAIGLSVINYNQVWSIGSSRWLRQPGDLNGTATIPGIASTWWDYTPPTGGLTNSTTGIVVRAAGGAATFNEIWSGDCYSDVLGTATEIELRNGASGAALWRSKIPTTGWTQGRDLIFSPPIRASANTLIEFAAVTASGTGSIYCNWNGRLGS